MSKFLMLRNIQKIVETVLTRKGVKIPNGYFDRIHQFIDVYEKHNDVLTDEILSSLSPKLSHPVRNLAVGLTPIHAMFNNLPEQAAAMYAAETITLLCDNNIPIDRTVGYLISNIDSVRAIVSGHHVGVAEPTKFGALKNTGALMNILGPHRFFLQGKPTFMVEQSLCEGLIETNFGMNTPSNFLRSPLPYCYIEFGDQRNLGVKVYNSSSGLHEVEGVYISDTPYDKRMQTQLIDFLVEANAIDLTSDSLRYIELEFTGSPLHKNNVLDDATFNISLFVDDNKALTVEDIFSLHVSYYQNFDKKSHLFHASHMGDEDAACLKPLLELLIKTLIFINSDLSTRRNITNRADLEKQLNGLKNPAKRRKLQRKLYAAQDYILISSAAVLGYVGAGGSSAGKSTHWRRGHFRNQPHGEGLSQVKVIWIQPTLIGVGSAQPKTYKVTM